MDKTKIQILHRFTMAVLFEASVDTVKDAVELAVKQGVNLAFASLDGARLDGASLDGASLDGASLDGASLDGASLDGASLDGASLVRASLVRASLVRASLDGASLVRASLVRARLDGARLDGASLDGASLDGARLDGARLDGASLDGASLDGARLDGASLVRASLVRASLDGARLDGARLDGARLDGARLDGASLVRASLPAPTVVLLASWGEVSPELCADLMLWDASNHPDPTKFDAWAKGGACPYIGVYVQRAAYFQEKQDLWAKGELCRPYDLMVRVLAEKCPEWTAEQKKEFEEEICKPLQVGDKAIPREFEGGPGMNASMRAMCGIEATIEAVGIYYTIGGWSWPRRALKRIEQPAQ